MPERKPRIRSIHPHDRFPCIASLLDRFDVSVPSIVLECGDGDEIALRVSISDFEGIVSGPVRVYDTFPVVEQAFCKVATIESHRIGIAPPVREHGHGPIAV